MNQIKQKLTSYPESTMRPRCRIFTRRINQGCCSLPSTHFTIFYVNTFKLGLLSTFHSHSFHLSSSNNGNFLNSSTIHYFDKILKFNGVQSRERYCRVVQLIGNIRQIYFVIFSSVAISRSSVKSFPRWPIRY